MAFNGNYKGFLGQFDSFMLNLQFFLLSFPHFLPLSFFKKKGNQIANSNVVRREYKH